MKFERSRLGVALAAVIGTAALAPTANAVNVASDGIGEVAIAPYYTTRSVNGAAWRTLVNLTNTTLHPVAVKIRVHEAWNSRDVFDITILMSAFDNFTAVIQEGTDGPIFNINDTDTCTAPIGAPQASPGDELAKRSFPLSAFAYGGDGSTAAREWDGGPQDIDRLREGYVEFLVMGHFTNDDGPNDVIDLGNDENGDGNPANDSPGELIEAHDCMALDALFSNRTDVRQVAQFAGEPINALKYNYRLINVARGLEAGGSAVAWANFFNPAGGVDGEILSGDGLGNLYGIDPDPNVSDSTDTVLACTISRGEERSTATTAPGVTEWNPQDGTAVDAASGQGSCLNLITAQTTFDFLEPSLNDAFPVVANGWVDRYNNELEAMNPLDDALTVEGRLGQPTSFPHNGVGTGSVRGIDAVSLTIQRSAVINEWTDNLDPTGTIGVVTDWILTFPTKTFYVDQDPGLLGVPGTGQQAGLVPGDRDEAYYVTPLGGTVNADAEFVPYPPFREAFIKVLAGEVLPNNTGSCVGVELNVYDRKEQTLGISGGSIPSPAPPVPGDDICFETNVLNFDFAGGPSINALGSSVNTVVDTSTVGPFGWMHLSFTDAETDATNSGTIQGGDAGGLVGWSGLPVVGFVVKQRQILSEGDVFANYASSMDHGYRRQCRDSALAWADPNTCPDVVRIDPN
jgi:hypothetical protein